MPDHLGQYSRACRAVGWLGGGHPYCTGPTSSEFHRRLWESCKHPVWRTRGFHQCEFCSEHAARGNGEIHVRDFRGEVFVAPALISHYVETHCYRPPDQFIEAVIALVQYDNTIGALSCCIDRLAVEPTSKNRDAFYSTFVRSRVGVRVRAELGSVLSRDYIASWGSRMALAPDGTSLLVVIADVVDLADLEAASTFVEFDAHEVLRTAVSHDAGILVHSFAPGREATAIIPPRIVVSMSRNL